MAEVPTTRWPDGNTIIDLLPKPNIIDPEWVQGIINDAAQRMISAYDPTAIGSNPTVIAIVKDYAQARAVVQHFVGEGNREAPAAEKMLDRAEKRLEAHITAVEAGQAENPTAVTEPVLPLVPLNQRVVEDLWWPLPMRETDDAVVVDGHW